MNLMKKFNSLYCAIALSFCHALFCSAPPKAPASQGPESAMILELMTKFDKLSAAIDSGSIITHSNLPQPQRIVLSYLGVVEVKEQILEMQAALSKFQSDDNTAELNAKLSRQLVVTNSMIERGTPVVSMVLSKLKASPEKTALEKAVLQFQSDASKQADKK